MLITINSSNCKKSSRFKKVDRVLSKRNFFVSYKKYKQLLEEKEEAVRSLEQYKLLLEDVVREKEEEYGQLLKEKEKAVKKMQKCEYVLKEEIEDQKELINRYEKIVEGYREMIK